MVAAYGDVARCEDVGSEAAAVDQLAQHVPVAPGMNPGSVAQPSLERVLRRASPALAHDQAGVVHVGDGLGAVLIG